MKVKKRDGKLEKLSFDKIVYRLRKIKTEFKLKTIDTDLIAQRVISGLFDGVTSSEIDEESARIAVNMTENLEYPKLAGRIIISNLHKNTSDCFSQIMEELYDHVDSNGKPAPVLSDAFIAVVRKFGSELNQAIDYNRDHLFDYFGFKTLEKSYLMKLNNKLVERPQHLYMRVAIQVHLTDSIEEIINTYGLISQHFYTFASPTLFNSGAKLSQLSSCFLLYTEDSIGGIFKTITDTAHISKLGGGIGIHISNIRSKGSVIRGTNGTTDGIIPMLKVYNETAKYVNQSSRRKGSFAIYLEPHHPDILEFLDLRKNQGTEDMRARDLFLAMWISDLFMKQVESDGDWYLLDPDICPGLTDVYGDAYEKLYWDYVEKGKYSKKIKAQEVWTKILENQIETGNPYILYKDSVNKKSNQKNIGAIKSSNLCCEVTLYSDKDEYAVCNLMSIALPKYIENQQNKTIFNHQLLFDVVKSSITPMNNIIDFNYYPVPETKLSNTRHRPLGLGIQGLSEVYIKMRLEYESDAARQLNKEIFETIYFAALTGSMEQSKKYGSYSTFAGSPLSEGKFQFDLWAEHNNIDLKEYLSGRWDWESLRKNIQEFGVRNSELTTVMPTASSAQIMGNTESYEPFDSCIFKRRVLSGEYIVVNKLLVEDLTKLGIWNKELKDLVIASNGSIQDIPSIPDKIKALYKTCWEMSMKSLIDQSSERGPYITMSQSFNCFMASPNFKKLSSMHFYGWKKGLKTGIYYLRSKAKASAGKFSIDANIEKNLRDSKITNEEILACSLENPESCEMCSS